MYRHGAAIKILFFLLTIISVVTVAQERVKPAFHDHTSDDYYTLEPKGIQRLDDVICWVQVGSNKGVIFSQDYADNWNDPRRVFSTQLTAPAKVTKAKSLMSINEGRVISGAAVAFKNYNQVSPSAKSPVGLLIIAFMKDFRNDKVYIQAVPFDVRGNKIGNFKTIKIIEDATHNLQIAKVSVYAACQEDTVGITISASAFDYNWPRGVAWSKAFFVETDLSGERKYNPAPLKLANSGNLQEFELLKPGWWSGKWFAPARTIEHTKSVTTAATNPSGSALYLFSATPRSGKSPAMKLKLLEKDDQANDNCAYAGVQLMPTSDSSNAPASLNLNKLYMVYMMRDFVTPAVVENKYSVKLYSRLIKKNGNARKAKKVDFEVPASNTPPDDTEIRTTEILSNPVVTANGMILLTWTRYFETIHYAGVAPATKEVEGSHAVYAFNLLNMAFELMFYQAICFDCWMDANYYARTILMGGYLGYLYTAYEMGTDYAKALVVKMMLTANFSY